LAEFLNNLIASAKALGATDAKLMDAKDIVVDPRSLLKCRFGCGRWGKNWTCQPNIGISASECQEALGKYSKALVIVTPDPKTAQEVSLSIEKKAMLEHKASYAFAMTLCVQCDECAFPEPCRFPHLARPAPDGLGIDIEQTVAPLGFDVTFDAEGKLIPAWYSIVLLD